MSAEKNLETEVNNLPPLKTPQKNEEDISGRVDINSLLARARKENEKEYKINFIFFIMFAMLVLIVGILLSF
jgi:hypothetical protein